MRCWPTPTLTGLCNRRGMQMALQSARRQTQRRWPSPGPGWVQTGQRYVWARDVGDDLPWWTVGHRLQSHAPPPRGGAAGATIHHHGPGPWTTAQARNWACLAACVRTAHSALATCACAGPDHRLRCSPAGQRGPQHLVRLADAASMPNEVRGGKGTPAQCNPGGRTLTCIP